MLSQIIRKEVLDHLMSLRFSIACILCFIVVACSIFVRHQDYGQTLAAYHEDSAIDATLQKQWDHPWRIIWQGVRVHHPPNPLKIFVRGIEDDNGYTVELPCTSSPRFESADIGNPLLPLFPSTDMITFVGVIMSLLAIVFGYDAICGERERGTLRLMLSYGVPRDTVLLGKWVGGYVTLIMPFLMAVIAGAAIMLVQQDVAFSDRQWTQFGMVCVLSLLYIAVIYSAAIWISSVTRLSSTSIMALVTLWMIFVLAIPNLSPYLAQTWRATRSLEEFEGSQIANSEAIWRQTVEVPMEKYDREHGFGEKWWEKINWHDWSVRKPTVLRRMYELELERKAHLARLRMFEQMDESFTADLDAQIGTSRWIARFSPYACFALASTEMTDTGIHEKRRLMSQLRKFQTTLCNYGQDEWAASDGYALDHDGQWPPPWNKSRKKPLPEFVYVPVGGGEYVKLVIADIGILAGMAIVFFMLSYMSFLRYDVR